MEIMEWMLECYYLKNMLDSYGISVIIPVNIPGFFDTDIGQILKETRDKFENELLLSEEENFHLTLFPIMNSIFVLPENTERRKLCFEIMAHLQKTIPESAPQKDIHTFQRLIKSQKTSTQEALEFLVQKWEEICSINAMYQNIHTISSLPKRHLLNNLNGTELLNKPYSVKEHTVLISREGCLIINIVDPLIKNEDISRLSKYFNIETRTLPFRFHISLAQVRTLSAYHYLKGRIGAYERNRELLLKMSEIEVVAYKHRSLSSAIQRKRLPIPLEV